MGEIDEMLAHKIQVVFEGDEHCNVAAYGYTPNGTRHAVCTTIQYGYKPLSNMTSIKVEPQAAQVMLPAMKKGSCFTTL
jgi:hypothetical protein